jgi:hypothetical protein
MDTLMDMVQRPNFKTCLSSRPWNEFATRLGRSPSLRLDQVTYLDMITYVTNRIHPATRGQTLTSHEARRLVHLVVERAEGVFLWIELVVRAVNVELKKGRGTSRVSSIVQDLPSELDDYFTMLIYERIDKTSGNISDTASVLSLTIQLEQFDRSRHPKSRIPYPYVGYEFMHFWLLSRGFLDPVMKIPDTQTPKYDRSQVAAMRERTRSFLELTSKDLLVLRADNVEFFHRTVFDFLMNTSVNNAIRERAPPHFQLPGFVLCLQTLRCVHVLMMSNVSCLNVDAILDVIACHPRVDVTEETNGHDITTAWESLAIDHFHSTVPCLGWGRPGHNHMHNNGTANDLPTKVVPYKYIRTLFRHWPLTAHIAKIFQGMRLQELCSSCTEIMHDCLDSGFLPDGWIVPSKLVPREELDPSLIIGISAPLDDGPRRSVCEFCHAHLPSSRDCGLRDAFFFFEKMSFERIFPNTDVPTQACSSGPMTEGRIVKFLPFELPWSMLRRADGLQALRTTLRFQKFVWCRQKLRAVRSLLTTIRRQFLSIGPPDEWLTGELFGRPDHPMEQVQDIWFSFLKPFIKPPRWRNAGCHDRDQCDCCGRSSEDLGAFVVSLRSDEFVTTCAGCYKAAAPPTHGSKLSFVFAIWLQPSMYEPSSEARLVDRGVVKAVSEIIAWYSDTAPAFGLGYLIPSDIAEIQRALLSLPESQIWALKT